MGVRRGNMGFGGRCGAVAWLSGWLVLVVGCSVELGDLTDGTTRLACPNADDPIPSCEDNGGCAGGEQGRMVGMVEAHNRVRARQTDPSPGDPLPEMEWSDDLAAIAQEWAERLASRGCGLSHSRDCRYGENLAFFGGLEPTAAEVVEDGWASEEDCYSFGRFMTSDSCSSQCDRSGGCGHFTQIIWKETTEVGCAVESCSGGGGEVWVCNYAPVGNIVDRSPY